MDVSVVDFTSRSETARGDTARDRHTPLDATVEDDGGQHPFTPTGPALPATILPASDQPGLELLGSDDEWFPVPCDPGSVAVNGGEMLDLATDGHYPATTHRVVNPSGEAGRVARMALPMFLHPADDVVLADDRTASEFLQARIAELRGD